MVDLEAPGDDLAQVLFADSAADRQFIHTFADIHAFFVNEIFLRRTVQKIVAGRFVDVREAAWENFVENDASDRGQEHRVLLFFGKAGFAERFNRNGHARMQSCRAALVSGHRFVDRAQNHAGTFFFLVVHRQIEGTEDHILGRSYDQACRL